MVTVAVVVVLRRGHTIFAQQLLLTIGSIIPLLRLYSYVPGTYNITGMWITADFRLYPPVITANQELVSPTGDHRYRGGTERAHPRGFRV